MDRQTETRAPLTLMILVAGLMAAPLLAVAQGPSIAQSAWTALALRGELGIDYGSPLNP